uniref:D-amino acid oxidase activator n=1 Tax=Nomascus leucogenys TaxID=61853 RepID=G1R8S0_NOMLE
RLEKLMGADSLQLFRSRYILGKIYFIGFQRNILLSKSENSLNSIAKETEEGREKVTRKEGWKRRHEDSYLEMAQRHLQRSLCPCVSYLPQPYAELEEVSSHVGKVLMARKYQASKDCRQPLERMWTCNYNQQKDQSCNHKEITSTKAE